MRNKKKTLDSHDFKKKRPSKYEDFTPEKNYDRIPRYVEEKSKSHQADGKKKLGKSTECMRIGRDFSPELSKSRSRSRSKSQKQLTKKKRESKASLNFQNSNIKKGLE